MTNRENRHIRAVFFDFDMTLVDSAEAITHCLNLLARDEKLRPVTKEEVFQTIGLPMVEALDLLWGRFDPDWLRMYGERYREEEYARLRPFDDTIAVLEALRAKGIRTGVASNRRFARRLVEKVGLESLFDTVVGLEDVALGKPDPAMLLFAVDALQCSPMEALYVGDTDLDMQAAKAAKMRGVGVTTGAYSSEVLVKAGAWRTVPSLSAVLGVLGFK